MSADNGIYILVTPAQNGEEYRVTEAGAIENLDYEVPPGWDYNPQQVAAYFHEAPVFRNMSDAMQHAHKLADDLAQNGLPLEYGISIMRAAKPWNEYLAFLTLA